MTDQSTAVILRCLWSLEDRVNDVAPAKRDTLILECMSALSDRGITEARLSELRALHNARR